MRKKTAKEFTAEIKELHAQIEELQETLGAIQRGEVDGLVVSTTKGEQIYSISGAEKPYRTLIEDMREGAVMLSDDNAILYANSGFAKMLKLPMEKTVGANIESMVCPTYSKTLKELLLSARERKSAVTKELTFQTDNDILVPTLVSVNSLQSDTLRNTFLVVTDLSEHMDEEVKRYTKELELAQLALSESEQRWSATLASIGDAVIATDLSGKITFINGVAEKLTGWSLDNVSGKPVEDVFKILNEYTRKIVENPVYKVLQKGTIVGLANHTILIRKDGTEVAIDDSGAPIKNKEGKTSGVVLVFRDITERRKAEEELRQAQTKIEKYSQNLEKLIEERTKQLKDSERLATIGATAGMVGHDIRNPLQAIVGDLYLVKEEMKEMPKGETRQAMEDTVGEIEKNIEYINKIVQDLQDFARPLKPNPETADLKIIIDKLFEKNVLPENIKLKVNVENDAKQIMVDSTFIHRIMYNLVTNAVQAMPKGGELTVCALKDSNDTVISVKDTGIGISESNKNKLFMPMFTTKARGQGFGLAVIKRMTEALGGTVTFESQEGKGTIFTIRLPPPKELNGKWTYKQ